MVSPLRTVMEYRVEGIAIAVGCLLGLVVGIATGSAAGWMIGGGILGAAGGFVFRLVRTSQPEATENDREIQFVPHSQPPDHSMKKLLFDDFQASGGSYVVKEVEEETRVVPSTKSGEPAPIQVKEETVREFTLLDFFDLDVDTTLRDIEPKSEFHSLLDKVLLVLKDVLFAHTVAFFWANKDKRQMVLESMATDSSAFFGARRFAMEGDLVSNVATSGKPQMIGSVNPTSQAELLRYYEGNEAVRSVVAVPVFFRSGPDDILPVGVIVADSKAEDAFGQETLALLGRVTKLVSALVKSYTDKYDLLLDSELLTSLRRMQDRIKSNPSEETVLASLTDEANRLAGWDVLTIVMYSDEHRGWVVQKVVNKLGAPYVAVGQKLDVAGSVVADAVRNNHVESIDDMSTSTRVRFHEGELGHRQGTFLCVPISSLNRCYGAVAYEARGSQAFSGSEVETLYRLNESAAGVLEVLYMQSLVKQYVSIDRMTGLMSRKHFLRKVDDEVQRAEDFGSDLSLVSIAVDNLQEHAQRYGKEGVDVILNEIARVVRGTVRPYDAVGALEDRMGVLLMETAASDAYLWAEKLRKMVAGHVITVGQRTISVTLSVGVCGLTEGMRPEDLMAGTTQVLDRAIERGGNLVRVV